MRFARIALIIVAVICFGVALSYPIRYYLAQRSNNGDMQELSDMRTRVQEASGATEAAEATETPVEPETAAETAPPEAIGATDATEPTNADGPTGVTEATDADGPPDASEAPGATETVSSEDVPTAAVTAPPAATGEGEASDATAVAAATADSAPEETRAPSVPVGSSAIQAAVAAGKAAMRETAEAPVETEAPDSADTGAPAVEQPTDHQDDAAQPVEGGGEVRTEASVPAADSVGPEPARADSEPPAEASGQSDATPATVPREAESAPTATPPPDAPTPTPTPVPTPTPGIMDLILDYEPWPTMAPLVTPVAPTRDPAATPTPAPTFDIEHFTGALPYPMKEKVVLDEDAILPELKEIYELNHDLVGWIKIDDTVIDYPVVQRVEDSEFYLSHDFYGEENQNGQIILDPLCDPYTPSYNLVISGHHMKNGSMFGSLPDYYINLARWREHMFLEFDTLMARKQYVIFAAFYSADYDEDEEGFRYNVNVRYRMDADPWLDEIRENQLYDTGIDVKFGDEFITLTTCNRARHRNGRFVVVCRRIREGETFE